MDTATQRLPYFWLDIWLCYFYCEFTGSPCIICLKACSDASGSAWAGSSAYRLSQYDASGALTIIRDFMACSVDSPVIQVADRLELPVRCAIQHIFLESGCSELCRVAVLDLINGTLITEIIADPVCFVMA